MIDFFWNWLQPRRKIAARISRPMRRHKVSLGLEALEGRDTPATFTVTIPGDPSGAHSGVSLRDAIAAANATPAADFIDFSPTLSSSSIVLIGLSPVSGSEFQILGNLTINGSTAPGGTITIQTVAGLRLFQVSGGGDSLTINNAVLSNGFTAGSGGAVAVNAGALALNSVTVSNNFATAGGGVAVTGGTATLTNVSVSDNLAISGGGIVVTGGTLTMSGSISDNNGTSGGGLNVLGGVTNLNNVTVSGNNATLGGGIAQTGGQLNLTTVAFNNNNATGNGGGFYENGGGLSFSGLRFVGNHADQNGGGLYIDGNGSFPGAGFAYTLFFDVNSTGNSAQRGGLLAVDNGSFAINAGSVLANNNAAEGGAFYVGFTAPTALTINGSTIRNNTATIRGGGGVVNGGIGTLTVNDSVFGGVNASDGNSSPNGAALTTAGNFTLNRTTIANNTGDSNGGGIRMDAGLGIVRDSTISSNGGAAGLYLAGGIVTSFVNNTVAFNAGSGVLNAGGVIVSANSIFANNTAVDFNGTVSSLGNNLFLNPTGFSGNNGNDLVGQNPLLGPLAVNGATAFPSFTHALTSGSSAAFNAGSNLQATNAGLTTDQRGSNRFVATVDIGAYELLDTIAPTATLTPPANINSASPASTTTIVVTYADPTGTGFESPSGVNTATFGTNDISVSNGAIVTLISFSGLQATYTVQAPSGSWSTSPQGTYTVSLNAGNVTDRAGNPIAGIANFGSFVVDTAAPIATLSVAPFNINSNNGGSTPNTFTVNYTDNLSGFTPAAINGAVLTAKNGATTAAVTATLVMGSGTSYSVVYTVSPPAPNLTWDTSPQGVYTIALVAGSVSDIAGNPIAGNANLASFSVNTVRPFATLTGQPANITVANATPGTNSFSITYSTLGAPLNPATYGVNDVTVFNGATQLDVISVSNSSNVVTYVVQAPGGMWTSMPQGQYTISLNGNSVFDTAGNSVAANATLGFFTVDAYRPTPTLTVPPATINANYAGPQSNTFTILYSDIGLGVDPTTFGTGNVTVANGATMLTVSTAMVGAPTVAGTPVTYTVLAPGGSWATAPAGTYTISIVANNVKDLAGNGIAANSNFAFFTVDLTRPTAVLTTPPMNINVANSGPGTNTFQITYTDTGSGMNPATFVAGNVTVSNGSTTIPVTDVAISGTMITYTITPTGGWAAIPGGTYTVTLNASAADFAGNTVLPVANFGSFTVDVAAPSVVVSPTGTLTNASPIVFTLNFSEPVMGLTAAGITVTNGTAGAITQVTTSQYTLPVTPTVDGVVTVTVQAGAAQDASGNPNTVSNVASVISDRTGPTTTFSAPSPTSTAAGPVTYTVTWTDPNFASATLTPAQVILNSTGTAGGTVSSVVVTGNTALITINNTFGNGTLSISLPAGVAVDTLGNRSAAAGPSAPFSVAGNRILSISQPPAPATLMPGTTYIYAIDYSNTGNQISPNARINVAVPNGGNFVAASSTPGWVNTSGTQYQFSFGNLGIGSSGRLLFAVNYPVKTPPGTVATFTATITDNLANGNPVATSTVSSLIINPNRLRWGRCC